MTITERLAEKGIMILCKPCNDETYVYDVLWFTQENQLPFMGTRTKSLEEIFGESAESALQFV